MSELVAIYFLQTKSRKSLQWFQDHGTIDFVSLIPYNGKVWQIWRIVRNLPN